MNFTRREGEILSLKKVSQVTYQKGYAGIHTDLKHTCSEVPKNVLIRRNIGKDVRCCPARPAKPLVWGEGWQRGEGISLTEKNTETGVSQAQCRSVYFDWRNGGAMLIHGSDCHDKSGEETELQALSRQH